MRLICLVSLLGLPGFGMTAAAQEETAEKNEFPISAQIRPRRGTPQRRAVAARSGCGAGPVRQQPRPALNGVRPVLSVKFPARCVGGWRQDAQIDKNGRCVLNETWAKIGRKSF